MLMIFRCLHDGRPPNEASFHIDQAKSLLNAFKPLALPIERALHAGDRRHQEGKHIFDGQHSASLTDLLSLAIKLRIEIAQHHKHEVVGFIGHYGLFLSQNI